MDDPVLGEKIASKILPALLDERTSEQQALQEVLV